MGITWVRLVFLLLLLLLGHVMCHQQPSKAARVAFSNGRRYKNVRFTGQFSPLSELL